MVIARITGIIGSLMGLYLWKDYFPMYHGDTIDQWIRVVRIEYVIFLYIPSSLAMVALLFEKSYLMLLAVLLSLPVTQYLGVNGFIDTFPLVYYPLICYIVSFIIMVWYSKKREIDVY